MEVAPENPLGLTGLADLKKKKARLALRQGRGAVGRVGLGRLAMVIHRRCRCPYSMNTIYSL